MINKKLLVTDKWKVGLIAPEEDLRIENDHDVIVKNHFTHLSAGTEMACLSGLEGWFQIPASPGYTGIGEVVEKGSGVTHVDVGDMVYTYSTHSQYYKLNCQDRWHGVCVKLPDGINPEWASFTHMAGIAMTAIRVSHIELGDTVLITGQGVIGILAAQLAQWQGATVVVTDVSKNRLQLAGHCGIRHTVLNSDGQLDAFVDELTVGKGVDCLIDATGAASVVSQCANLVGWNGEIILLGSPRAPFETNLTGFLKHFHYMPFNHSLKGALEFAWPTHQNDFNKHSIERNAAIILNMINMSKLKIAPFYSHKADPADAQQYYEGLRDNPDEYIGVVFDWRKYQ